MVGRQHRTSTKEEELPQAKQFAEDWYLTLRGKARAGLLKKEKTFDEAADQFEKEYEVITEGQRSARWTEGHKARLRIHLRPFFGKLGLSEVTPGKVQEYRVHRMTVNPQAHPPDSKSNRKPKEPLNSRVGADRQWRPGLLFRWDWPVGGSIAGRRSPLLHAADASRPRTR